MSIITLSCHKRTPLSYKLINYYAIKTITFLERSLWTPEYSARVTTVLSLSLRASSYKQSQHSAHESHLTHITVLITLQVHFPYACKQDVWPSKCFAIITAKWNRCSQQWMLSKVHEGRKYIHKKGCTKFKNWHNMWVWQPPNLSFNWRHTDNHHHKKGDFALWNTERVKSPPGLLGCRDKRDKACSHLFWKGALFFQAESFLLC